MFGSAERCDALIDRAGIVAGFRPNNDGAYLIGRGLGRRVNVCCTPIVRALGMVQGIRYPVRLDGDVVVVDVAGGIPDPAAIGEVQR